MSNTAVRSVEPLVVGRVIGDVVDHFSPSVELAVRYGSRDVTNGCSVRPSATTDPPCVQVLGRNAAGNLYTLVMTDPDAPSPSEPSLREWLHWLVVDIPGGSDATKGKEVVQYTGPRPPIGIHRYAFVLFRQEAGPMDPFVSPPHVRANFCTRGFAAQYGLGTPAAAVYFNAQRESAGSGRRLGHKRSSSRN